VLQVVNIHYSVRDTHMLKQSWSRGVHTQGWR